ncbi:MAG: hypothetical protein ACK5XN_13700 [Bacteroidota bacterium]|jgi:hypothetical protein
MKKLFMSLGIFISTYFLLSIDVSDRPIFDHLYDITSPLTKSIQQYVEGLMGQSLEGGKDIGEKLFNNSVPKKMNTTNKVFAPQKQTAPAEDLSEAEKQELNSLIKNYSR